MNFLANKQYVDDAFVNHSSLTIGSQIVNCILAEEILEANYNIYYEFWIDVIGSSKVFTPTGAISNLIETSDDYWNPCLSLQILSYASMPQGIYLLNAS